MFLSWDINDCFKEFRLQKLRKDFEYAGESYGIQVEQVLAVHGGDGLNCHSEAVGANVMEEVPHE